MRFTLTSAPASASKLRTEAAAVRESIANLTAERDEIESTLPDLVGDPVTRREAEDRLATVNAELGRDRRTATLIEAAIPAAEDRERREAFARRKTDLERRTEKLKRGLDRRWNTAAAELAKVATEIEANETEWKSLGYDARELGERSDHSVEFRARRNFDGAFALRIYQPLLPQTRIPRFEGGMLFDGTRP